MRVNLYRALVMSAIMCVLALPTNAEETVVEPGIDTLFTAVTTASDNDVLILKTGTYLFSGVRNNFTIAKPLIIKAQNKDARPVILLSNYSPQAGITRNGQLVINTTSLVLQGVEVKGANLGQSIRCFSATSYSILQSTIGPNVNVGKDINCNPEKVLMVGNKFIGTGSVNGVKVEAGGDNVVLAGNDLQSGEISITGGNGSTWIVGNKVVQSNPSAGSVVSIGGSNGFVVGNRISTEFAVPITNANWDGIVCSDCTVASNVVVAEIASDRSVNGIRAVGSGFSRIYNNIVIKSGDSSITSNAGIRANDTADIANNIVVDTDSSTPISAGSSATIRNNICHQTTVTCDEASDNINADPLFADTQTYRLAANSPAINQGTQEYYLSDVDRTRNDIGAYGGPWSIGQYDDQRNDTSLAPYVYPLIDITSAVTGNTLQVKALGVAKLR